LMNYSQWFAGEGNWVADLLSRDLVSSNHEITTIINSRFPSQVPKSFKVSPLPAKISSFLSYWVQLRALPRGSPAKRTAKPTPPGDGGSGSLSKQTSSKPTAKATPTWTNPKPTTPLVPLSTRFGCAITADPQKDMLNWLHVHAVPPSMVWLRPSSQQTSPTPDSTLTENFVPFTSTVQGIQEQQPRRTESAVPSLLPLKEDARAPGCPPGDFYCFSPTYASGFLFRDAKLRKCQGFRRAANPSDKKTQHGVPKRRPNSAAFIAPAPLSRHHRNHFRVSKARRTQQHIDPMVHWQQYLLPGGCQHRSDPPARGDGCFRVRLYLQIQGRRRTYPRF